MKIYSDFQVKRNSGLGLILSIFLILLFSLLSIIAASMFSSDIEISVDSLRSTQAFFIAEAAKNYYRYYLKADFNKDQNWSNNKPVPWTQFAQGEYAIDYIKTDSKREATIKFTGKVGDVTRKILCVFKISLLPSWFNYCYYTGEDFTKQGYVEHFGCTGVSNVNDPNDDLEMINLDVDYAFYKANADVDHGNNEYTLEGNVQDGNNVDSYIITGVHYIKNKDFTLKNYRNVTINGSIIVDKGKIILTNIDNIQINPNNIQMNPNDYPGLVCNYLKLDHVSGNINSGIFVEAENKNNNYASIDIILNHDKLSLHGILYSEFDININLEGQDPPYNKFTNKGTIISHKVTFLSKIQEVETAEVLWDDAVKNVLPPGIINPDAPPEILTWGETF